MILKLNFYQKNRTKAQFWTQVSPNYGVKFQLPRNEQWIVTIDWIVVDEFEPLLLIRQAGGLTRVNQPLKMRARIPVQWQNKYDV